jgi:hypothetical protein
MRHVVIGALLLLRAAIPASAQVATDDWQVTVVPYLMGAGLSGTAGAHGLDAEVDVAASDILSHLEFGLMGIVAARKGAWGIGGDVMYVALGATADRPAADVDFNQTALAFYGSRTLGPALDVTFGLRINGLDGGIDFRGPLGVAVSQDKWWVDPIVGLLVQSPADRRTRFRLYTEVGGFGAGSDIAWQVFPSLGIRMNERVGLELGYRWQGTDYESGEGTDRFVWDTLMQGPAGGLTIRF